MLKSFILSGVFLVCMIISMGCQQNTKTDMPPTVDSAAAGMNNMPEITKAVAVLHGTKGNNVTGNVTFLKEGNQVKVIADVYGLKPGKHGFHIHEYGDCSADDGTSAGGHFNPDNVKHGAPTDPVRHVGDLGNIFADQSGHAHLEATDSLLSFTGNHSIIGRGVIVHAGEDNLKSQPSGNAGPRVACGVIGIAKS